MTILPQRFYQRNTLLVAQDLLGCFLCRHRPGRRVETYRIVETEGYCGTDDLACHASKGRTPRTEVMFGPAGHAYVYFVYGMHHLLNIVTEGKDYPAAVLIRAIEHERGNGPAKLTKLLAIDRSLNALPVFTKKHGLWIERGELQPGEQIKKSPRVGIDYAGAYKDKPWRFSIAKNEFVSKK